MSPVVLFLVFLAANVASGVVFLVVETIWIDPWVERRRMRMIAELTPGSMHKFMDTVEGVVKERTNAKPVHLFAPGLMDTDRTICDRPLYDISGSELVPLGADITPGRVLCAKCYDAIMMGRDYVEHGSRYCNVPREVVLSEDERNAIRDAARRGSD